MSKAEFSGQDEQVSLMIERIRIILNNELKATETAVLIGRVIQMKENGEADKAIKNYISSVTGIEKNNEKLAAILAEIEEKPFQNNYFPFQNSVLEQLKKDLEKE